MATPLQLMLLNDTLSINVANKYSAAGAWHRYWRTACAAWLLNSRGTQITKMCAQTCEHIKGLIHMQTHTFIKQIMSNVLFQCIYFIIYNLCLSTQDSSRIHTHKTNRSRNWHAHVQYMHAHTHTHRTRQTKNQLTYTWYQRAPLQGECE